MYVALGTRLLPWHAVFLLHAFDNEHKWFSFFLPSIKPIKPMPGGLCENTSPLIWWGSHFETFSPTCLFLLDRKGVCSPHYSGACFRIKQQGHGKAPWGVEPQWEAQNSSSLLGHSRHLNTTLPGSICSSTFQCGCHTGTFIACRQQCWANIRENDFR